MATTPATPSGSSQRLWQIDALRGLMLVLMTLTHLPTILSSPLGQPFGFVSAAEGFVLLSGFMAGLVYAGRHRRDGETVMRSAFFKRVVKIYLCQAALLLFLFTVVAVIGVVTGQEAITGLMRYYLSHPLPAIVGGLLLVYSPPLLDILPMYILLMVVSPLLLVHGLQRGWTGILAISVALWVGAQFELGHYLYEAAASATGLPVPLTETGAFDILAWQLLWVIGLWLGAGRAQHPNAPPLRFPRWMVLSAIAIATVGFVWRHAIGQIPFPGNESLNLMLDKWQLAPLRLINLFALLVLVIHYADALTARLPRLRFLETLGAASLPVFCAHLVLALLVLAFAGAYQPERPLWVDGVILFFSFAALHAVALVSAAFDRQAAVESQRWKKRLKALEAMRQARRSARGAARSLTSTPHTRQG